jgi:putative SOS response-associated peptidase YedK
MEQFEVSGTAPQKSLSLNWNIAPTNPIYIVRGTSPDLATVSWGLIAPWLKTLVDARNSQSRAINARSESIFEKPTFKDAFRTTRCLIPASGYYEWATALGKYPPKQPFYISSKDDKQLPIAGIWSSWVGPSGEIIETASIITQEAQGQLEAIHSRMPVFIPKDRWQQWLNPKENNVDRLKSMMVVEHPDLLVQARPVSHAVNSVARNGKELTVETPLGEPETLF